MKAAESVCDFCGGVFAPAKPWARFCSEPCRVRGFRRARKAGTPAALVEKAMAAAMRVVRSNTVDKRVFSDLRQALDAYEAFTDPKHSNLALSVLDRTGLLFEQADLAPTLPASEARPTPTPTPGYLLDRLSKAQAKFSALHVAKAIGFKDGSMLSHWRNGRKDLTPEKAKQLTAWLEANGF